MSSSHGLLALLLLALPALAQVAVPTNAVEAARQFRLAEAARQRGDEAKARQLAGNVLEFAPDDFAARSFLGFTWSHGRWRLAAEIAYLDRADAAKPAAAAPPAAAAAAAKEPRAADPAVLLADTTLLLRRLWSADEPTALQARDALIALAVRDGRSEMVPQIEQQYLGARQSLRAEQAAVGTLAVRLQNVRLLGFDTITVGFGSGSGRLMLPRTESVSFAGTIAVPLGSGN